MMGSAVMLVTVSLSGLAIGAVIGWILNRLSGGAIPQSVAAAVLAFILSTLGISFIWARYMVSESGVRAVTVSLVPAVMGLVVVGIAAAGLHVLLGWLGRTLQPSLGGSRPVVVGAVAGLVCALMYGVALSMMDGLK